MLKSDDSHSSTSLESLRRGIFVKSLNDQPFSLSSLQEAMHQFGVVDRVVVKSDPTFYAIVEFSKEEYAQHAVLQRRLFIDETEVAIGERYLSSARSQNECPSLNVFAIIEDLSLYEGFDAQSNRLKKMLLFPKEDIKSLETEVGLLSQELGTYFGNVELQIVWPLSELSILEFETQNVLIYFGQGSTSLNSMKNGRRYIDFRRNSHVLFDSSINEFIKKPINFAELKRVQTTERNRLIFRIFLDISRHSQRISNPRFNSENCSIIFTFGHRFTYEVVLSKNATAKFLESIEQLVANDETGHFAQLSIVFRTWMIINGTYEAISYMNSIERITLLFAILCDSLQAEGLLQIERNQQFRINVADKTLSSLFQRLLKSLSQKANNLLLSVISATWIHTVSQKFWQKLRRSAQNGLAILETHQDSLKDLFRPSSSRLGTASSAFFIDTVCESAVPAWVEPIDVLAACETLLEEVAFLTPSFGDFPEEANLDDFIFMGTFLMSDRMWLGRRNLRRRINAQFSGIDLERRISELLFQGFKATSSAVILSLSSYLKVEDGQVIIGFKVFEGSKDELNRLTAFIQYLLDQCLNELLFASTFQEQSSSPLSVQEEE